MQYKKMFHTHILWIFMRFVCNTMYELFAHCIISVKADKSKLSRSY